MVKNMTQTVNATSTRNIIFFILFNITTSVKAKSYEKRSPSGVLEEDGKKNKLNTVTS